MNQDTHSNNVLSHHTFVLVFLLVIGVGIVLATNYAQTGTITGNVVATYCHDSDTGIDANKQGVVEWKTGYREYIKKDDTCIDKTTLTEWHCSEKIGVSSTIQCATGRICTKGACRELD